MATVTAPSKTYGGGFQNVGCYAPPGVGHDWYAAAHGDVFGTHITNDGINWRPSNKGIGGPHHAIRNLRGSAIEGSQTVANRLWAWCGQTQDGQGGGNLVKGTYSTSTGLVSWTNFVQANDGPAGGTTDYGHPRMLGRLLALDEANDTAYGCGINGIVRIQGINGAAGSATITNARALAGQDVTGLVLDPTNPQIGWATVRRAYTGKANTPGVYRLTNLRSGTVTAVREAFTDCQDLCLVDTGTNRYLFVAAMNQGIRRWLVSTDITTGWTDVTSDYEPGASVVGTGAAGIDAVYTGSQIQVLAVNAGNANLTNGGGYTRLGLNSAPDWVNENPGWTVNMVPWGETDPWWLSVLIPGLMLNGTGYDSGTARIDPNNPNIAMLIGRSGIWRSQNAWQTWRPAVKGTVGVMCWTVAARPGVANQNLHDGGDWSVLQSTNSLTATTNPVRPRPGGCLGLMWTADGAEAAYAAGDPFAGQPEAGVFVSTNGGTTWVDQDLPSGVDAHGVAIGYNSSGQRVLLTVYRTGIYRKVGSGGWSVVSTLTDPQPSQAHNPHFCWPQNTNTIGGRRQYVYCTGHAGLLRSDDWGATWTTIHSLTNSSESAGAISYDPAAPNTLYYTVSGSASDGLWKITNAAGGSPTATRILALSAPGPCAVDPNTGVVYVATTALEPGGVKLYASPANNPGAGTTFVDLTDAQWEHGPWAPCDMSVTEGGQILISNRQGGLFVAERDVATTPTVLNAAASSGFSLGGTGSASVAATGIVERTLAAATVTTNAAVQPPPITPTGMVEGDWMLAQFSSIGGAATHAAPDGWARQGSQVTSGGASMSVWRKRAGATEAGPYQFNSGATGNRRMVLQIRAFTGADPTAPVEGEPGVVVETNATSLTHPALEVAGENRRWVLFTAKATATADTTSTLNTPAGFVETADTTTTSATLANTNAGIHHNQVSGTSPDTYSDVYDDIYGSSSGSTGPQAVTSPDAGTRIWLGLSLLLAPAAAPDATPTVLDATASSGFSLEGTGSAQVVGVVAPEPIPGVAAVEPWFNGSWWPALHLLFGLGGTLDPGPQFIHLGVGPGLGVGQLGGTIWTGPLTGKDIRSVTIHRGKDSPIDSATPGTATIVLNNGSGAYDPDNPASPYATSTETLTDTQPTLNYTQSGQTTPSSSGCTNSTVTMQGGGSLHDMGGASTSTPNGTNPAVPAGTYTFWNDLPSSFDQVRWTVRPDLDPTSAGAGYFWAEQGTIAAAAGGSGNTWYAGLQSRSALPGNPKAAIFSIWNAVAAVAGDLPNTAAQPFSGEGVGYQILAPYTWTTGRSYRLRVRADSARGSRWFACYLRDETSGTEVWVGSVRAATSDASRLYGVAYQWTELFGQQTPATTCPLLPRSTTFFATPTFATITSLPGVGGLTVGTPVDLRAERPLGTIWRRFYGEITNITLDAGLDPTVTLTCADGLEKLGRAQLSDQPVPVGDGDRSGQRVNRLLDAGGYPSSLRRIDTGYTTVAPTALGDFTLELLRKTEMTEFGLLFCGGDGLVVFYDRHRVATAPRSTTVQVVFADSDATGTAGMVDLELDWSRDRTFNDVHITREATPHAPVGEEADDDQPAEQVATDFATQQAWGTLSLPAQVGPLLRSDDEARAMAEYLVDRFKTSQSRIRKVTVNCLRKDLWDLLLPLTLLDRIRVDRNYGPRQITEELLIQGMTEEINSDPPTWTFSFDTTVPVAAPTLWRLGTSALGSGRLGF
jgi:hypothetical protein